MAERPDDQDRNVTQTIREAERLGDRAKRAVDELVRLLTVGSEGKASNG